MVKPNQLPSRHPGVEALDLRSVVRQGIACGSDLLAHIRADLNAPISGTNQAGRDPLAQARQDELLRRLTHATRVLERLVRLEDHLAVLDPKGHTQSGRQHADIFGDRADALTVFRQIQDLDEEALIDLCRARRWPEGFRCRHCDCGSSSWIRRSRASRCRGCGRFEGLFEHTSIYRSRLPIKVWVLLTLTVVVTEDVPAVQLARWVSLPRPATVGRIMRKLSTVGGSLKARNIPLTLTRILEALLKQRVNHQV